MSAPTKPWENQQFTNRQSLNTLEQERNTLNSRGPQYSSQVPTMTTPLANSQRASGLPALPQRPPQLLNNGRMMMGPPGLGGYGGYSMACDPYRGSLTGYGSYSPGYGTSYGSGYGFGPFPVGGGFENRFLQVAEEGSRDAFQSIESLVRAFTSVSMMLESTYYAMYSSFNAILGVVDNFSRLRNMFIQFISTITFLRMIRNFYRRLLYWLGVLDRSPEADRIWDSVSGPADTEGAIFPVATSPKWPLLTFLALLFGGPYLVSKFLSTNPKKNETQWARSKGMYVRAAYPHQAGSESELNFKANEVLNLAPKEQQPYQNSGWLLAVNQSGQVGYIPVTRLATSRSPQASTPVPVVNPVSNTASTEQSDCHTQPSESH